MSKRRSVALAATITIVGGIAACGDGDSPTGPAPDEVTPEIVAWLRSSVAPFETVEVRDDRHDLQAFGEMVGSARIVSLGEATHGTREFFAMKHRILDYLVREKGFTIFAIEATWPEMNRIDDWVKGAGQPSDAETLLAGQYFWTWNTETVFDLMHWARDYNLTEGAAEPVSVLGFDMQFPGMAIHNVRAVLEPIDPDGAAFAAGEYECLPANDPSGSFSARYDDASVIAQAACRGRIDAVHDYLVANRSSLETMSSSESFARALQSARLVQQFEDFAAGRSPGARDLYMAENVDWLLEQAGPDARAVLWAHNGHVRDAPGWMGSYLRAEHGSDMVIVGFDFDRGSFTAVATLPGGVGGLQEHTVGPAPAGSYESYFRAAGEPRFFLDLRGRGYASPATSWLAGPRLMRAVGAVYTPLEPERFFLNVAMPQQFDVMIYIEVSSATTLLSGIPPDAF
ncbi:MAG: erythromycin esterase family protein [Gemmatimonadota bacterium]|nr:erythromycin esterase family protein [Gemmatimonadota bacterium]